MYLRCNIILWQLIMIYNIQGAPMPTKFFDSLKSLKCPSLDETVLNVENNVNSTNMCSNFSINSVTKWNNENIYFSMCSLYYSSYKELCEVTKNRTISRIKLSDTIKEIQPNYNQTKFIYSILKKPLEDIINITLSLNQYHYICLNFDESLKPICNLTALMRYVTLKISKAPLSINQTKPQVTDAQPVVTQNVKSKPINSNLQKTSATDEAVSKKVNTAGITQNSSGDEIQLEQVTFESNVQIMTDNEGINKGIKSTALQNSEEIQHIGNLSIINGKQSAKGKSGVNTKHDKELLNAEIINPIGNKKTDTITNNPEIKVNPDYASTTQKLSTLKGTEIDKKISQADDSMQFDVETPQDIKEQTMKIKEIKEKTSKIDDGFVETPQDIKEIIFNTNDVDIKEHGKDDGDFYPDINQKPKLNEVNLKSENSKPLEIDEDGTNFAANYQNQNIDDSDSYFFSYFMMVCVMFIFGYIVYHNKQKIVALVVEGRRGRRQSRTRRPNSANYRKLDSNLEEAVTSSCNKNTTQVIY